jgi:hypothetical protein
MSIMTTVNAPFKVLLSEEELAEFIKTDILPDKFSEHIFIFFTEVSVSSIYRFIKKHGISLEVIKNYYLRHIKPVYQNKELEEMFSV